MRRWCEGCERPFKHPRRGHLRYRQATLLATTQVQCKVVVLLRSRHESDLHHSTRHGVN